MKTLSVWLPRPNAQVKMSLSTSVTLYGLPVMHIEPIVLSPLSLAELENIDTLFFVSQHAVRCFFSQLSEANFHSIRAKQMIAIGEQTADALYKIDMNVTVVAVSPFTSESLLKDTRFLNLSILSVAIISAESGRTILSDFWRLQGKKVTRIVCYRRNKSKLSREVMVKFLDSYSICAISISSCEIADAVLMNLISSGRGDFWQWPVFAYSQRIADYMTTLGFQRIIVAKAANQQSLNHSILAWWEQKGTNE